MVVTSFSQSATTRDTKALDAALTADAVQHVKFGESWSALPTPTYLQLMREKKIGGEPVQLTVHEVEVHGLVATVRSVRTTPTFRFDDVLTLTHNGSSWKISGAAIVVTPVTK
jgi:hypothetical protein